MSHPRELDLYTYNLVKQTAPIACAANNGDLDAAAEVVVRCGTVTTICPKSTYIVATFKWRDCGTIEDLKEEVDSCDERFRRREDNRAR